MLVRIPIRELLRGERIRSRSGGPGYVVANVEYDADRERFTVHDTSGGRRRYRAGSVLWADREASGQGSLLTQELKPRARLSSKQARPARRQPRRPAPGASS